MRCIGATVMGAITTYATTSSPYWGACTVTTRSYVTNAEITVTSAMSRYAGGVRPNTKMNVEWSAISVVCLYRPMMRYTATGVTATVVICATAAQ